MKKEDLFYKYHDYAVSLSKQYMYKIHCTYFNTEDGIQCGLMGLWEATSKYVEGKETVFKSFAYPYIIGRIKDNIRSISSISRTDKQYKQSKEKLYHIKELSITGLEPYIRDVRLDRLEDKLIHNIDIDRVNKKIMLVLKRLPPNYQYILYSKFFKHLPNMQIFPKLSESGVCDRFRCARQKFAKLFIMLEQHPNNFILQKEYSMPDLTIEQTENKNVDANYTICIGEVWKHNIHPHEVVIDAITDTIITYRRTTAVGGGNHKTRIVNIPRKMFCEQFHLITGKPKMVQMPIVESVESKHNVTSDVSTNSHTTIIPYASHCRLICEICRDTPVVETELNHIFSAFNSYDIVIVIMHDMLTHETWLDMNNAKTRIDIMERYINKYKNRHLQYKLFVQHNVDAVLTDLQKDKVE